MSIFGVSKEEFDSFQSNTLARLSEIEKELKQRPTDFEQQARTAATNATDLEQQVRATANAVQTALSELNQYKNKALEELSSLQTEKLEAARKSESLIQQINTSQTTFDQFNEAKINADTQILDLTKKVEQANTLFTQSSALPETLKNTQELLNESKSLTENLKALLGHAISKKAEIDELHKRILGQEITDAEGNSEHIDGLKDELEKTFHYLSEQAQNLTASIDTLTTSISSKHDLILKEKITQFEQLLSESNTRYVSVNEQLIGLLPGSMAAGLSAAYEKKKEEESDSLKAFEKTFRNAIITLVCISTIPLTVDIYLLAFEGKSLVQVIKDTPNLIMAILPIYFPVLWLAYSTNKKLNLSKRLIEEYTHKSVLGKTFSGLSNQIETLPHQSAVKEELRTRLLFNVSFP